MEEKTLVKLSLICGFFGLFLLFIAFIFVEAEEVGISGIEAIEEKDVKIRGEVISIKDFDSLTVVEIAEIKSVNVVVFDKRLIEFEVGDKITVSGELRDYKGEKEIIAENIKIIRKNAN